MNWFKNIFFLIILVFVSLSLVGIAEAGFGISPPYVSNDKLNRGSHYEQKIVLSRGNPDEDLKAEIIIEESEIKNWITIEPGLEFILPKDQQQVSIIVKVDVPTDTEYKNYKGIIRIRTTPINRPKDVQVNVVLGARIDVDLTVSKEIHINFVVKTITAPEVFLKKWPFSYNNQIKIFSKIENQGNVIGSPTKMSIEIYDINEKKLLESRINTKLTKIKSFTTEEIITNFSTKLVAGQYWAKVKIFSGEEVKYSDKIILTLKNSNWEIKEYLILLGGIIILIILILIIIKIIRRKRI